MFRIALLPISVLKANYFGAKRQKHRIIKIFNRLHFGLNDCLDIIISSKPYEWWYSFLLGTCGLLLSAPASRQLLPTVSPIFSLLLGANYRPVFTTISMALVATSSGRPMLTLAAPSLWHIVHVQSWWPAGFGHANTSHTDAGYGWCTTKHGLEVYMSGFLWTRSS